MTNWDAINEIRLALVARGLWRESDGLGYLEDDIKATQEHLHRAIGQWARVAHRRVAERAARERVAMGAGT